MISDYTELKELLDNKSMILGNILKITQSFNTKYNGAETVDTRFSEDFSELYRIRENQFDKIKIVQERLGPYKPKALYFDDELKDRIASNDDVIIKIMALDKQNTALGEKHADTIKDDFKRLNESKNINLAYQGGGYTVNDGFFIDRNN